MICPIHRHGRIGRLLVASCLFGLLAACSNVQLPAVIRDRMPGADAPSAPPPPPAAKAPPAITARSISLAGNCKQTEVDGFAEDAQVQVQNGNVQSLSWKVKVGRKGSCSFDGTGFRQTKTAPSIEMLALDGSGCRLLMWADDRRVTLAHNGCQKFCTAGVYDKVWPVMFDPRSGGCADASR